MADRKICAGCVVGHGVLAIMERARAQGLRPTVGPEGDVQFVPAGPSLYDDLAMFIASCRWHFAISDPVVH